MILGWDMCCYDFWWNIFGTDLVHVNTLWIRLLIPLRVWIRNRHWMRHRALHRTGYWYIKRHIVKLFFFLRSSTKMFDLRLQWFIWIIILHYLCATRYGSIDVFTLGSNWFFHHHIFIILKTGSYLSFNIIVVSWDVLLHRFNDMSFIILNLRDFCSKRIVSRIWLACRFKKERIFDRWNKQIVILLYWACISCCLIALIGCLFYCALNRGHILLLVNTVLENLIWNVLISVTTIRHLTKRIHYTQLLCLYHRLWTYWHGMIFYFRCRKLIHLISFFDSLLWWGTFLSLWWRIFHFDRCFSFFWDS